MHLSDIFVFLGLFLLVPLAYAGLLYAPWVPTKKQDLQRILKLADLQKGDLFYELGSGDGRVSLFIAKNSPAQVIGFEIAYPLFFVSLIRSWFTKTSKGQCRLRMKNFFHVNLSDADVIFTFGMPKHLGGKLRKKLDRELTKGTRVLSYSFAISGWKEVLKSKPTEKDVSIYLYEV